MGSRWMKLLWIAPLALMGWRCSCPRGPAVRWLWNWLTPPLFGFHPITFWQAIGLLALSRILFGGLGLHGSGRRAMSAETRGRFRQRMRERVRQHWGFGPTPARARTPESLAQPSARTAVLMS